MSTNRNTRFLLFITAACSLLLSSCSNKSDSSEKEGAHKKSLPNVPIVKVEKLRLNHELSLPGELRAYQDVPIHAKVEGYVKWIGVDRGSIMKKGDKMITIFCPELDEKTKESLAKVSSAEASYRQSQSALQTEINKQLEAKAKLDADRLTYERLVEAAKTPGAIARNEVDIADKTVEADKARVQSEDASIEAAKALVRAEQHNYTAAKEVYASLKDMQSYLTICAPFDGVITERNVHEGSIVAVDASHAGRPLVRIQQKDILRLVVAVPEADVSGITLGQKMKFIVPAFMGKRFTGTVVRPAYALDEATRTMPVELNVDNKDGTLEPGMFATVYWKVTRPNDSLFVPTSAVDSDLAGTFAIRIKENNCERIEVHRGLTMNNLIEVSGPLQEGEFVALKATDELKNGTQVNSRIANEDDIETAAKHSSAGGE